MVDFAYVCGMADDSGNDFDHEVYDPEGHCGPTFGGGSGGPGDYQPGHDVTCRRCGTKSLKWRGTVDGWRLFHKERDVHNAKIQHNCHIASADDFDDIS